MSVRVAGMSAKMSAPRVGIHRLIDAGRSLQKYEDQPCTCTGKTWNRKISLVARPCEENPAGIWTIDFVQGIIWFGDNPCRKYTENHGICDRKKLAKNTKNNKVYAQPIQEIQRKLMFFDRSLKPGKTKNGQPRGDLCSGFKFICKVSQCGGDLTCVRSIPPTLVLITSESELCPTGQDSF